MTTPQNSSSQEKGFFYKKRGLGILLLATACLAIGIFFILLCFDPTILTEDNHKTLEDIRNLALIIATVFAWLFSSTGLWLANRARVDREDNLNISRQSLNSGRFQKAVEMINKEKLNAKLGGLRILRHLIKERPHEHELKIYNLAIADWLRDYHPQSKNERATDQRDIVLALFILDKDDKKKFFDRDDEKNTGLTPNNYRPKDLSRLDLAAINLSGVDFQDTDLNKTNLTKANLTKAKLQKAKLQKADLQEADLNEAILNEAILSGTDLRDVKYLTREQLESARWDKDNRPKNVPAYLLPLPHDGTGSSDKETPSSDKE